MTSLRIGLTGGIGSGKSTVSAQFARRGAVVVDADVVAREVVEPGMPPFAAIVERFGPGVLAEDGTLDRPALGSIVFGDGRALADLEAITHPAIWARTAELLRAATDGSILVHDMPLLVEKRMAADYHLTVVVGASEQARLDRLVGARGMSARDARARIAAQAGDDERRAAADVWLDNEGTPADLALAVDRLWDERIVPYAANLRGGIPFRLEDELTLLDHDPRWATTAARLLARMARALGGRLVTADHIGSTAVPGLIAKPVIDLQLGVASLADADEAGFVGALASAGFPRIASNTHDNGKDGTLWGKRYHLGCDPGVALHVHVREVGSPGWRWALMFRDWLRADPQARADYTDEKVRLRAAGHTRGDYALAKEPWFDLADARAGAWAARVGWTPTPARARTTDPATVRPTARGAAGPAVG